VRTPVERKRFEPGEAFDASQGLATPEEIAALYRVKRGTVMGWGRSGSIPHIRTPGNHYRFSFAYHRSHLAAERGDHG
jgi:excisionase family DNA binding protein